jgi:hypothetical protein
MATLDDVAGLKARHEYKVITLSPQSNKATIELNAYAEEGWAVVTCAFHPMNLLVYTLKREVWT